MSGYTARHIIQNVDKLTTTAAAFKLYRTVLKELPRVLVLYDIDMPLMEAKKAMVHHFRKYDHVRDPRYSVYCSSVLIV